MINVWTFFSGDTVFSVYNNRRDDAPLDFPSDPIYLRKNFPTGHVLMVMNFKY